MRMNLKSAAVALTLAAATFGLAGTADAQPRRHSAPVVSVDFGGVLFGYRNGYMDRSHRYHRWNNDRDHRDYRSRYSRNYRDRNYH
jgi:hypothetical protein